MERGGGKGCTPLHEGEETICVEDVVVRVVDELVRAKTTER